MSKRSDLITQIVSNLAFTSNVTVNTTELPFESGGNPLYLNNMNTVYIDEQDIEADELYRTLDQGLITESTTTINAYFATDAKESFSDIETVVTNLLLARTAITGTVNTTSDYETAITDDVITYTFEYKFITV